MLLAFTKLFLWLQPEATQVAGGAATGSSAPGPAGCGGGGIEQLGLLAVMFGVLYFLMIRPQQKRQKEHDQMLKALTKGSVVRTTGGIRGEIVDLDDNELTLRIADKTKVNVLRSHIAGPDGQTGADTEKKG